MTQKDGALSTSQEIHGAKARPGAGRIDYRVSGVDGLQMRVSKGGQKVWRLRSRALGVITLGFYPALSLSESRAAARLVLSDADRAKLNQNVGRVVAPIADRRKLKDVLDEYEVARGTAVRSWPIQRRAIEGHFRHLFDRPARSITETDVVAVVSKARNITSKRAAVYVSTVLRWARVGEPVGQKRLNDLVAEKSRDRVLADAELRAVLSAPVTDLYRDLLWMLAMTAGRRGDVFQMRLEDIGPGGTWAFIQQKSPGRSKLVLPLPAGALETIERRRAGRTHGFVFEVRGGAAPSNHARRLREIHRISGTSDWSWHDVRRSSRTLLSRCRMPPHLSERILGHSQPGLQAVYDLHDFRDEVGEALETLERALHAIVAGNVEMLDALRRRDNGTQKPTNAT